MPLSVKSQRVLQRFGVPRAFERGEKLVLVGPTYELRKAPAIKIRLAFLHDADGQLCVGYADDDEGWRAVEFEPFSLRALGYYERRLKRIGEFVASGSRASRR